MCTTKEKDDSIGTHMGGKKEKKSVLCIHIVIVWIWIGGRMDVCKIFYLKI